LITIEECYISSDILEQNAANIKNNLPTLPHEGLALVYSNSCKSLMHSHLDYAKAAGKIAYDMLNSDQTISDSTRLQVIYNMELCKSKYDSLKAIEYYEEAEKINPNDHDIIHAKFIIYVQQSLLKMALMEVEKFPHSKAELYKMYIKLHMNPNFCTKEALIFNNL